LERSFEGRQVATMNPSLSSPLLFLGAPDAQISETPGSILGEIISGQNINIASGAKIQGVASVPDSGSCMWPGRMRDRGGEKVAFMSRNCGPNDGSSIFQPFL
jgi:hypothetical protein